MLLFACFISYRCTLKSPTILLCCTLVSFSGASPLANAGDPRDVGSIPGSGIYPGEGNGNPVWYSCLDNPMNKGPW